MVFTRVRTTRVGSYAEASAARAADDAVKRALPSLERTESERRTRSRRADRGRGGCVDEVDSASAAPASSVPTFAAAAYREDVDLADTHVATSWGSPVVVPSEGVLASSVASVSSLVSLASPSVASETFTLATETATLASGACYSASSMSCVRSQQRSRASRARENARFVAGLSRAVRDDLDKSDRHSLDHSLEGHHKLLERFSSALMPASIHLYAQGATERRRRRGGTSTAMAPFDGDQFVSQHFDKLQRKPPKSRASPRLAMSDAPPPARRTPRDDESSTASHDAHHDPSLTSPCAQNAAAAAPQPALVLAALSASAPPPPVPRVSSAEPRVDEGPAEPESGVSTSTAPPPLPAVATPAAAPADDSHDSTDDDDDYDDDDFD